MRPTAPSRFSVAAACGVAFATASGLGCGSSPAVAPAHAAAPGASPEQEKQRANVEELARAETTALEWLSAADPRLAARTGAKAPHEILERIGTDAVLAEDATARIRGASLDLFSFAARGRALDEAAKIVASMPAVEALPVQAHAGGAVARPRLERELLARLVDEERARLEAERALGEDSGALVRAVVATWTPPVVPQDWSERDTWVAKHLLEIRDSLKGGTGPLTGPTDLDVALDPLERLLAPLQFPRGAAAMAQVRVALEEDMRAVPPIVAGPRIVRGAKSFLGVAVDPADLAARVGRVLASLEEPARTALEASGDARPSVEARARELLMAELPCPAVNGSRVRSAAPPPERAAICGVLRAYGDDSGAGPAVALVALHDDVLLATAAVTTSPTPRTGLLSHPDDDVVDAIERAARERPLVALAVVLAAELVYIDPPRAAERFAAWRAFGDAPLDIVAREIL